MGFIIFIVLVIILNGIIQVRAEAKVTKYYNKREEYNFKLPIQKKDYYPILMLPHPYRPITKPLKYYTYYRDELMYSDHSVNRSPSEAKFEESLKKYFPNNYSKRDVLKGYVTDYTIFGDGIYIDVEIDEPYTLKNKSPIHFMQGQGYSDQNARRDSVFLQHGWIVIRFAEEQIIKKPTHCCHFIRKVYSYIKMNNEFYFNESLIFHLGYIKRWTYDEARDLAKNRYRENLLV